MHDNILFILENDITDETVLAVLSALQSYHSSAISKAIGWNKTVKAAETITMSIDLVLPNSEYDFIFEKCLPNIKYIFRNLPSVDIADYTYISYISIARGRKMQKPLAQGLGILIGAEADTLPDVTNLVTKFSVETDLLFYQAKFPNTDDLCPVDTVNFTGAFYRPLEERAESVFRSNIVVGKSSFETYLACALKKPTLELQKDPLLYKWSNPNYVCVTTDDEDSWHKGLKQCIALEDKSTETVPAM